MYRLLFVLCVFVCTVTDCYGEDGASGVQFCRMVQRCPGQGISHLGNFAPQAPNIGQIGARQQVLPIDNCSPSTDGALSGSGGDWRLSAILALGMCGYMAVPADRRTC